MLFLMIHTFSTGEGGLATQLLIPTPRLLQFLPCSVVQGVVDKVPPFSDSV